MSNLSKFLSVIILSALLLGCATTANYQSVLNNWQGRQFQTLVACWGAPESGVRSANGNTTYLYNRHQLYTSPLPAAPTNTPFVDVNGTPMATTAFTGNFGGKTTSRYCLTWFEVNPNGIIVGSRFQGNSCVANRANGLVP